MQLPLVSVHNIETKYINGIKMIKHALEITFDFDRCITVYSVCFSQLSSSQHFVFIYTNLYKYAYDIDFDFNFNFAITVALSTNQI